MELESIKELVIQASQTFYSTQDKEQRRTAEEWLNEFKKSVHAWYVTDQILHTNKNEQVLFFAAQTIRTKIQYCFHELPADSHESLRNSLLEHLEKLSTSSYSTVQTQIYIALSDLIMLMSSWQNPVPDIIQRFTKPPDRMHALIEFLTILPEEINNKRLKLGQNRRDQLRQIFSHSSLYIIQFLEESLKKFLIESASNLSEQQTKIKLVYRCFSSWIEERLIDSSQISQSTLLTTLFQLLLDSATDLDLHDVLTNCLINILLLYPFNAKCVDEQQKQLLLNLKENIFNCLVLAYKNAEQGQQSEKCSDLCLIFTELCNALSFYLLNEPNKSQLGDLNCINLLLMCGRHADYEVFQRTFLFWFNISEEIYTNPSSEKLCLQFRESIYSLIDCVCKHCRLDPEHDSIPPSKSEDFGEFRLKASDLVADVVFIVEANQCFEKMYQILQSSGSNWFEIESALFVMCSFAKSISQDEEHCVTQVVQAILSLPVHVHVSVKCTGIRLIGELCEWLNQHWQFIDAALNFVCQGFSDKQLSQVAANTMLNICTQCQSHMLNHLETLINIIISTDTLAHMASESSMELLKGAVVILCNLPPNEITQPLMRLCNIQFEGLQKVLTGDTKQWTLKEETAPKALPLYWLDRYTAIFRTIKIRSLQSGQSPHPIQPIIEQSWPVFKLCLEKYQQDSKVTESCCRAMRFALRSTEKHSRSILTDLVHTLVQMYRLNHFSCFLYLGSILVDIYGTEDAFKNGLVELMQAFTNEAFDFIIKSCSNVENIGELRKHPDTLDDFFRLSLRFLQRCPYEFVSSPIFSPIMTLAVTSLNIDHRDANLSITKFLSEFISIAHKPQIKGLQQTNYTLVNGVISEIGEKMIENSINSTINMTTRDTKDGIADVVCELLTTNRKHVEMILLGVLKNLRKTNQQGNEIVTERQLVDIHKKIVQSSSSSEIESALIQLEQLYL